MTLAQLKQQQFEKEQEMLMNKNTCAMENSASITKNFTVTLEADGVSIEFSNLNDRYHIESVCHELIRLCSELRISSNTLIVSEIEVEQNKGKGN